MAQEFRQRELARVINNAHERANRKRRGEWDDHDDYELMSTDEEDVLNRRAYRSFDRNRVRKSKKKREIMHKKAQKEVVDMNEDRLHATRDDFTQNKMNEMFKHGYGNKIIKTIGGDEHSELVGGQLYYFKEYQDPKNFDLYYPYHAYNNPMSEYMRHDADLSLKSKPTHKFYDDFGRVNEVIFKNNDIKDKFFKAMNENAPFRRQRLRQQQIIKDKGKIRIKKIGKGKEINEGMLQDQFDKTKEI